MAARIGGRQVGTYRVRTLYEFPIPIEEKSFGPKNPRISHTIYALAELYRQEHHRWINLGRCDCEHF
jgi:hypothetical protein